jgi:hypothetical protein
MKTVQLIEAVDGGGDGEANAAAAGFDVEDGFEFVPPAPHSAEAEQQLNTELEAAGEYDDIPF